MKQQTKLALSGLMLFALGACSSSPMPKRDLAFAPAMPPVYPEPSQKASGTIYQAGYEIRLFEDIKARRVGDTLTIRLVEKTDASKSAKTATGRSTSATVSNPTLFGTTPQFDLPGVLPLASTENNNLEASLRAEHDFEGDGDSQQRNSLSGEITVTVAQVLPNGNLIVRGEKRLNLNQGNEYVKISGIVRPTDITSDNSVASTKVADATIIYSGDGALAAANKLGWLARFFTSAIFPF